MSINDIPFFSNINDNSSSSNDNNDVLETELIYEKDFSDATEATSFDISVTLGEIVNKYKKIFVCVSNSENTSIRWSLHPKSTNQRDYAIIRDINASASWIELDIYRNAIFTNKAFCGNPSILAYELCPEDTIGKYNQASQTNTTSYFTPCPIRYFSKLGWEMTDTLYFNIHTQSATKGTSKFIMYGVKR